MKREIHLKIDDATKDKIEDLAKNYVKKDDFYTHAQENAQEVREAIWEVLPHEIQSQVNAMLTKEGPDLLSISNLPFDKDLPLEGELSDRIAQKSKISEYCLIGVSALLNARYQKEESSHQPGLIHQITPVKSFEHECSGRGRQGLPFHVENAFCETPPSFLGLFCIAGEENVGTEYVFLDDIINFLDATAIETLKRPIFTVCTGEGFSTKQVENTPVLEELGNEWKLGRFYEEDRIFSDDEAGKEAIQKLHEAIIKARDKEYHSVVLQSGTCLLFKNGVAKGRYGGVMHGRRGQIKSPNPTSTRWLQRVCFEVDYQ